MTASYNPAFLATNPVYQVRFLLHDTNVASPKMQDEEIIWLLTQEANVYMAAAVAAEEIVTRLGGGANGVKSRKIGDLSISYSDDIDFYVALISRLKGRGLTHQIPWAGGLTVAEKDALRDDTAAVQPFFTRELFERGGIGGAESDEEA